MKKEYILFKSFFLAGAFTFAGGIAMLPIIKKDLVNKHHLIEEEEFLDTAVLAQTLPGMIALNFACIIGKKLSGFKGILIAAFGTIAPAYFIMLLATIMYNYIPQEGIVQHIFIGVRAASAASILTAAYTVGKHAIKSQKHIIIAISAFLLLTAFSINTAIIILVFGLIGYLYERYINAN